jgi:hypothetical protein
MKLVFLLEERSMKVFLESFAALVRALRGMATP